MTILDGVHFRIRELELRGVAIDVGLRFNALSEEAQAAGDKVEALRCLTIANGISLALNFGKEDALAEGANHTGSAGANKPGQEGDRADL